MADLIAQAKQLAQFGTQQFLRTFAFVPDDRLTWSPAPTARSPLRLAAHAGQSNFALAAAIRGETPPAGDLNDMVAQMEAAERTVTTREQATQLIESSLAAVLSALDGLTPERIAGEVVTPFSSMPMALFMNLPGIHMSNHAAQVDYLQTVWGDMEYHV